MRLQIHPNASSPRRPSVAAAAVLASAVLVSVPGSAAMADTAVAAFYQGKTMRMVIGYPPGAGYDLHARPLARHIGKHIPGNPSVISQNMPGAGSLQATNELYNRAPRDGTVLGAINRSLPLAPLLETNAKKRANLRFDALKFNWIGSMSSETSLGLCRKDSGFLKFDDLRQREAISTAASPTSDSYVFPTVFNNMLGTKVRIVSGRQGSSENFLALERGEAECYMATTYGTLQASKPDYLSEKSPMVIVVQTANKKHPDLADVPWVMDYADARQKQALELLLAPMQMGRPYMTTPDVPADRLAALRAAFDATMKDPDFLAEAKKTGIDVDPMGGKEVQDLLARLYKTEKDVVEMLQKALP